MRFRSSITLTGLSTISLWLLAGGCSGDSSPDSSTGQGAETAKDTPSGPNPLSVVFQTDEGQFEILLRPDLAPRSSANFCNLVHRGFYHGLEFVGANAVARGLGETPRTPSYQLPPEFSNELFFDRPGIVAWSARPRAAEDDPYIPHPTRFFISMKPQSEWNLSFVPFGTLTSGEDVLLKVQVGDWITSARIKGDPTWLMEQYAEEIDSWNQELDMINDGRRGDFLNIGSPPVSSN